jgi:hypothetical protein
VKKHRAPWFQLCVGLTLTLGLAIAPVLTMAADPPRIVGTWEGVLDPGAQPKKHIVVHIAADQDGSLSGTIDFPDQDVSGVLISGITYKAHALHFESTQNLSAYDGNWKQGATPVSLTLKRTSS